MKDFRSILLAFIGLILLAKPVSAQQDPQYTQYMFNGLAFNPAYAGSREAISAVLLLRKQWVQLEGSPSTGSFTIHGPSANERHGLGFSVVHDRLGITRQSFAGLSYAYRLPLASGVLSLGLRGGVTQFTNRYSDIVTINPDQQNPGVDVSTWLPRVGTGFYFNTKRFYIGFSAPNILAGRYSRYNNQFRNSIASEQRVHYFSTAGVVIPLSKNVDFKPSVVGKFVKNAPWELDLNATLLFRKVFWVGAGYRTRDAAVFLIEYMSLKGWRIGYSYDYTLTQLNQVNTGSHEILFGIDLGLAKAKIITPRYF